MHEVSNLLLYFFFFMSLYVQVFLLITFLEYKGQPKKVSSTSKGRLPSATIIVPCFNEARTLYGTIRSLLALNYPKAKLSILIIDDGSTDGTENIGKRFAKYPNIRFLKKENGGKHTALNLGLSQTTTDLVGCLDADSFVDPDALRRIVSVFENKRVMAVTPAIKVKNSRGFIERIQHVEYTMGIFLRKMFGTLNAIHVTPGPFSIFRREVFTTIGHYKEAHQTEDLEMALRMHANKLRIENAEDAFVYTTVPSTIGTLLNQRRRWIGGFLRNAIDYRRLFLRPSYGNIGLFTLPGGVLAIISICYLTVFTLITSTEHIVQKIADWKVVNFDILAGTGKIDMFYIHPHTNTLLTLILLLLGVVVIILSKRMAGENDKLSKDLFYFLFLYGLVAPLWILNAVLHTILGRKLSWK